MWGWKRKRTQNNYQQFAQSRLHREEYFQLLDPWERSKNVIKAHTLLADKTLHLWSTWFLFALCIQVMVKKKKNVGRINDTIQTAEQQSCRKASLPFTIKHYLQEKASLSTNTYISLIYFDYMSPLKRFLEVDHSVSKDINVKQNCSIMHLPSIKY